MMILKAGLRVLLLLMLQVVSILPYRISILTSVYNGDLFIRGFLEDITQQTIFDQCELIIVNANSPGNEEPVIKEYMLRYPNIVYVRLDKDPGLYAVWNYAITLAQSEFLTNANIDDRLHPNCYALHVAALDAHPHIDLVYSDYYVTHKPNESFAAHTGKLTLGAAEFSKKRMLSACLPGNHPMWRTSLHQKYGLFDERYKCGGDWEMWLRAVVHGAHFKKVPGILGLMYLGTHNISLTPQAKRECHEIYEHYRHLIK